LLLTVFPHQTSDAVLKLTVFDGVDERIDTTVDVYQNHGQVIEPASKVDGIADITETEQYFIW